MKRSLRSVAIGVAAIFAMTGGISCAQEKSTLQQEKSTLQSERDKFSYAVGLDVGRSFAPVAEYVELTSFERALQNALAGKEPLQSEEVARTTDAALRANLAAAQGAPAPGTAPGAQPPRVAKDQVGLMLGERAIGPSLAPIKADLDLAVMMQALRTSFAKGQPLLSEQEAMQILQAYMTRKQAGAGADNRAAGAAFLEKNKTGKGVITTPSGLQYMVLRQGSGARPTASSRVRVNYEGKLLDGTVFDSSYKNGQPAEFALNQVIPGWTEGVALMPVGAKYRFWIPSSLAYGATGTPGGPIGPDAMLTFDVELMGILQ
ncbi:MAG TPA: FKBP-type peptidyl-prolyl cis-trans isomerase [Pseudoxanthomonas sp.]|nr:FKBP-type peptidyl-prolyl cis-trans isomerase [Pseudoxanthomonas sp.]